MHCILNESLSSQNPHLYKVIPPLLPGNVHDTIRHKALSVEVYVREAFEPSQPWRLPFSLAV